MTSFDPARFQLGTLCAKGHEFENSGKSLRYIRPINCVTCAIEYRRNKDAKARALREISNPPLPEGVMRCAGCKLVMPQELTAGGGKKHRCAPCRKTQRLAFAAANPDKIKNYKERRRLRPEPWALRILNGSKSSSKIRKLDNSLSEQDVKDLWTKQNGKCFWTGVDMELDTPPRHPLKPSLDRLDPTKGYFVDNIVLSCLLVNIGRGAASVSETERSINKIAGALRAGGR